MDNRLQLAFENDRSPVIRVAGDLDYHNCEHFFLFLQEALSSRESPLRLELAGLDFIDSSGLRVLAKAAHEAQENGLTLNIVSLTPHMRHLLTITGFDRLFKISSPLEEQETPLPAQHAAEVASSSLEVPSNLHAPRRTRNAVFDFARRVGFDPAALEDIRLAAGEAVSNAIRHGSGGDETIRLTTSLADSRLVITIEYPSDEFDPHSVPKPDFNPPSEGGMGIYFMKLVMDDVKYQFRDGYATVILSKSLPPA